MDLYYLDYISVTGTGWLYRLPAAVKMIAVLAFIGVLLSLEIVPIVAGALFLAFAFVLTSRIPLKPFLALTLYPILFLLVLFLSIEDLSLPAALLLASRVLSITAFIVILLLSTSFPAIFGTLGRILPAFLVAALFYTYRSIFVISRSITAMRTALHLRGGFNWRHPVSTLRHLGMALGHVLIHSIETSERMADGLTVRGFANRIYSLGNH